MGFTPRPYIPNAKAQIKGVPDVEIWTPIYWDECSFPPEIFRQVMMNLIRNPNINSNHLFRADILLDVPYTRNFDHDAFNPPRLLQFESFDLGTVMLRRLIPRNPLVDKPLDQTCLIFESLVDGEVNTLVVYLPHISSPADTPFYHPAVHGIAYLHTFKEAEKSGVVSIHYSLFENGPPIATLDRIAQHLLRTIHKHGHGIADGYQKRVHHDAVIPQAILQNTYTRLKAKYAKTLISQWVEVTDPTKHVFEDLGIAAFLIELWAHMYPSPEEFPGFVDIGCGNGLLVHILLEEGFKGWGFDARRRKSWNTYSPQSQENLKELVLVPSILNRGSGLGSDDVHGTALGRQPPNPGIHSGEFPRGTFIVSNHADELTPWTPILATLSKSPFMMIPCCSHNLTGGRFRAPPPKQAEASNSAYSSLVTWVTQLAGECGWNVEKEMLRIPSTRNAALIGRSRASDYSSVDVAGLIHRYGGASGWEENALKLVKGGPRGH